MQEILISREENIKKLMLVQDEVLVEYYEDSNQANRIEGNIYIGRITNILPGMQACFVDIGTKKNTFIQAKDLMPKVDETKKLDYKIKDITEIAKIGQRIIVQVKKDESNKKGAKVSTHIKLTGEYLVLMPETDIIAISQKIEDEKEKQRLRKIAKEILPKGYGAIIRTSSYGVGSGKIQEDLEKLIKIWKNIKKEEKDLINEKPKLLYQSNSVLQKLIIDTMNLGISKIIVDNEEDYNEVCKIIKGFKKQDNIKVIKQENILYMYDLEKQIDRIVKRVIWLNCGGFVTIDKTEALTAIDVNSGKFTGGKKQEDSIIVVNKEAAEEIAKQIRLRDIDGIIVIDFIDMVEDASRQLIIDTLKENIKKDRSKVQIMEFTKLNLLEMTRKHMFSNNLEKGE